MSLTDHTECIVSISKDVVVVRVRSEALRDAGVHPVPGADDREAGAGRRPQQGDAAGQDEEPAPGRRTLFSAVVRFSPET